MASAVCSECGAPLQAVFVVEEERIEPVEPQEPGTTHITWTITSTIYLTLLCPNRGGHG